ncbi:amidase family protein [Jiangella muralis]|uniref:amidase family protein n=1 Tax=Jiangella muralis TaxID=702383 RepID=UPI0009FABB82|nr:amidase family protein [Jiangella muralis]
MLESGELTSVQLVQAYLERIEALNKRGPGLNAVTQINPAVMAEARRADELRAQGVVLGPAHGLPVLLKDLIDVKGMYTSNGNYSLRNSYPEDDAGIVKKLRENGVVILGKVGLSEWANSFGSQPSGFGNLTGQVLNANDADQNPSGSSSGTGAAGAAALSVLTVGTETSGSIISPSGAQSLVGIRPTVGIVPAYGIGPISSSQDTAGPMDRTVANAAMNLQSMVGRDPKNEAGYAAVFGPNWRARCRRRLRTAEEIAEPNASRTEAVSSPCVRGLAQSSIRRYRECRRGQRDRHREQPRRRGRIRPRLDGVVAPEHGSPRSCTEDGSERRGQRSRH